MVRTGVLLPSNSWSVIPQLWCRALFQHALRGLRRAGDSTSSDAFVVPT